MNNEFEDYHKVGDTVYYVSPTHKKCVKKSGLLVKMGGEIISKII